MERLIKTASVKAEVDGNGHISGYAATWTREPDSYGDVIAQGAFAKSIERHEQNGDVLPLLFNHDSYELKNFIGTVTAMSEDDHGLYFEAEFDAEENAQKARKLAQSGRLAKFSFAYTVQDQAEVELEDGRKANELREVDISEISLVLYPANPDTSVTDVKSGRRNSKTDEEDLREAVRLIQGVLGDIEGDDSDEEDGDANEEEPAKANSEERSAKAEELLKRIDEIVS